MSSKLRRYLTAPSSLQTRSAVIRWRLTRLIPACLLLGAGMEAFMIRTGFYDVALRKAAERRQELLSEQELYWKARREREMNLKSANENVQDKH